jgi:riboflavin synthase
MYTGIIEDLGQVTGIDRFADSVRLTVHSPLITAGASAGSSVAVNGVCLTVTQAAEDAFTADVMGETLARTSLGTLDRGWPVNLERPVMAGGRLDGHIVQGHVDGTGTVTESRLAEGWRVLRISIPAELLRYVAKKGSVAVDGVSLTVSDISQPASQGVSDDDGWFEVSLIPETIARTTLGRGSAGDTVNIEVDVIAKYVERLLAGGAR